MATHSHKGILKNTNKYNCVAHDHLKYRPVYRVWNTMLRRCTNPKCSMYKNYGGRGIKVCERWANTDTGFINFWNDMGPRPNDKDGRPFQIDRIDNNGDYCPENCRWIDAKENAHNTRKNIYIYIYGDKYCLSQACDMFGLKRTTVSEAIRVRGKTPTQAFINALNRRYSICQQ